MALNDSSFLHDIHWKKESTEEFLEPFLTSYTEDPASNVTNDLHSSNGSEAFFLNVSYVNSNFEAVVFRLNKYGLPSLILIGVVGNSVSFIVFTTTHLRSQSSSIYLAFLNVVDAIFLGCTSFVWLSWVRVYWIHQQGWCQTVVFLSYVSSFLSVWTVVSFTVERFLVVYLPLWKERISTRTRALAVVSGLALFAVGFYSYALWTTAPILLHGKVQCAPIQSHLFHLKILSSIDTFTTMVLPSVVIVVLNILIGRKIWTHMTWRIKRLRKQSMGSMKKIGELHEEKSPVRLRMQHQQEKQQDKQEQQTKDHKHRAEHHHLGRTRQKYQTYQHHPSSGPTLNRGDVPQEGDKGSIPSRSTRSTRGVMPSCPRSPTHYSRTAARQNAAQMRTTRTLLIISSAFVLLNLPSHVFRVCIAFIDMTNSTVRFSRTVLLWQHLCQILYYANFSLNFFMYCTCSRRFRMAFHLLVTRKCIKLRRMWETLSGSVRLITRGREETVEQLRSRRLHIEQDSSNKQLVPRHS